MGHIVYEANTNLDLVLVRPETCGCMANPESNEMMRWNIPWTRLILIFELLEFAVQWPTKEMEMRWRDETFHRYRQHLDLISDTEVYGPLTYQLHSVSATLWHWTVSTCLETQQGEVKDETPFRHTYGGIWPEVTDVCGLPQYNLGHEGTPLLWKREL